jgi:hypothetical protein
MAVSEVKSRDRVTSGRPVALQAAGGQKTSAGDQPCRAGSGLETVNWVSRL